MITLDQIITSNLEMLSSQEAELMKSLSFVQKAIQLFKSQGGSSAQTKKTIGRPKGAPKATRRRRRTRKAKAVKPQSGTNAVKPQTGKNKETHLSKIMTILQQKNGKATSAEVIESLFKQQSNSKDIKNFRLLIYPVLTKAYRKGVLKLKDGMINMP
jgi:hypothetical protein